MVRNGHRIGDGDTDNEGHVFFIEILKNALQVIVPVAKLQELDKNQFKLSKSRVVAVKASEETSNRFRHLEIQDIDEPIYETLPSAGAESKAKSELPPAPKKYKLEDLDEINEYLFALGCFMEDVMNLQGQVKSFWEQYADAELDLTTVSVTSNVAVEMVKKAEEEFNKLKQPSFLRKTSGEGIPMMWFVECIHRDGVDIKSMRDFQSEVLRTNGCMGASTEELLAPRSIS